MTGTEPQPILSEDELEDYEFSETGEWVPVGDIAEQRAAFQAMAEHALTERARGRVLISIAERDLARLKAKAAEQGMSYEALVDSILHDYAER